MTPENFKKGIEELRKTRLTTDEKEAILKNIIGTPSPVPQREGGVPFALLVREVFAGYSRFSYALAAVVIFLFSGSSVMYAAERAVPGDVLYGVKVRVTEPLRDKFIKKPEARAGWETAKAVRRLEEAETLALSRKLDEPRRIRLEQNFEKHADGVNKALSEMKETKNPATSTDAVAEKVRREFDSAVSSHGKTLEEIRDNTGMSEKGKKEINSLKETINRKVSDDNKRAKEKPDHGSAGEKRKR